MYRQIYTLPFQSIEENDYLVVIEKDGFTGTSTELTGSTSPFTMETSLDSPLSPYRLSTATLKIFGGDYLQNLFTPNPQGVRVKLLKNNVVEWIGFVTNDTYSQDYSNIEFEYEIELVNPLSTLKHKKYKNDDLGTLTFYQLIVDAIKETNSEIKKLYLSRSITNELNQNIYEIVSTASANYVDEQDEKMTYYEILEEIAKYLSLTITIDKGIVYFIDYIGISKGYNSYYEYTIDSNYTFFKNSDPVTLSNSNTIQLLDYAGDSSKLQINSGKNKAKVTCSLYDIDEIVPNFDDKKAKSFTSNPTETYPVVYRDEPYTTIIRNYTNADFTFYNYTGTLTQSEGDTLTSSNTIGSKFVRTITYKDEEKPNVLNLNDEILIRTFIGGDNPTDEGIIMSGTNRLKPTHPIFTVKSNRKYTFLNNTYFYITFNYKMLLYLGQIEKKWNTTRDTIISIPVELKVGSNYYNGTSWTTTPSKFNVNLETLYVKDGIGGDHKVSTYLFGDYNRVKNTNDYTLGIGEVDGYIINPPTNNIFGAVELTLFSNDSTLHSPNWTYIEGFKVTGKYNFIKDFKFGYVLPSDNIYNDYEESKSDIVYENIIDTSYVEELEEEIELKICTFPPNYRKLTNSSAFISSGSNLVLLESLKYSPLNIIDIPEKILINKVIDYFKTPKYQISIPIMNKLLYPYTLITDANLTGKRFIYAGNEIDYEFEKNNINLIEI